MKVLSFMSRRRLFIENRKLREENERLEKEVYETHKEYEKYMKELKKSYSAMDKRNDTLAKDNRILMTTMRKKDKQIIELKQQLKHEQDLRDNALKMYDELLEGEDKG